MSWGALAVTIQRRINAKAQRHEGPQQVTVGPPLAFLLANLVLAAGQTEAGRRSGMREVCCWSGGGLVRVWGRPDVGRVSAFYCYACEISNGALGRLLL